MAAEATRARILARLGRYEESVAVFRRLLAARPADRVLREDFAEVLIDAGRLGEAALVLEDALRQDPRSSRLHRLRARLELEEGEARLAADRLRLLLPDLPGETGLLSDLAGAELRQSQWRLALGRYGGILALDPDHDEIRAAYVELRRAYAPRFELMHRTLLQVSATSNVEEAAWRGWLGDRWWLRAGVRYATYEQDPAPGLEGFREDVVTALVALGLQLGPRWTVRTGLEESVRGDVARTTFKLGGAFDDGRATVAAIDVGVRELLTNPVSAVPLSGTTDRASVDLLRRLVDRVTATGRYEFRHYRASGEELGYDWDVMARADLELVRGRVQVTLFPLLFFQEYTPVAGDPLRSQVNFIRRQHIGALGIALGADPLPGLHVQIGSIGKYDWYRGVTSYEVSGSARWRIQRWLEFQVLYTRSSEGTLVGGKEENFVASLAVLY